MHPKLLFFNKYQHIADLTVEILTQGGKRCVIISSHLPFSPLRHRAISKVSLQCNLLKGNSLPCLFSLLVQQLVEAIHNFAQWNNPSWWILRRYEHSNRLLTVCLQVVIYAYLTAHIFMRRLLVVSNDT